MCLVGCIFDATFCRWTRLNWWMEYEHGASLGSFRLGKQITNPAVHDASDSEILVARPTLRAFALIIESHFFRRSNAEQPKRVGEDACGQIGECEAA